MVKSVIASKEIVYYIICNADIIFEKMQDTPEHVKQIQLDISISETMSERWELTIKDNDALFQFWKEARKQILPNNNHDADLFSHNLHTKI